jgi:hypothetical protein
MTGVRAGLVRRGAKLPHGNCFGGTPWTSHAS